MCAGVDIWTKRCGLELASWRPSIWIIVNYGIIKRCLDLRCGAVQKKKVALRFSGLCK